MIARAILPLPLLAALHVYRLRNRWRLRTRPIRHRFARLLRNRELRRLRRSRHHLIDAIESISAFRGPVRREERHLSRELDVLDEAISLLREVA